MRHLLRCALIAALGTGCTLTELKHLEGGQGGASASASNQSSASTGTGGGGSTLYVQAVIADGPRAYWRLGESAPGAAADQLGTRPGEYVGSVELGVSGALASETDTAVMLDGTSAYVLVGPTLGFDGTAEFSIEAWMMPTATDNQRAIVARATFNDLSVIADGYRFILSDGQLRFERSSQAMLEWVSGGAPPLGSFSHVVGVYDGADLRLYLDGNLVGTSASSTPLVTSGSLALGVDLMFDSGPENHFAGALDEVAIYDHALSDERIVAHFQAASR